MKAITIEKFGKADTLTYTDMDRPTPGDQEVLIEVHATGINPVDYKIRNGDLEEVFPTRFPKVLGGDISGVITELGSKVSDFKVGDEVFLSAPLDQNGGYAQYTVVHQKYLALKPSEITHIDAASLPVTGLTAIQTLRNFSGIKKGDNVMIHAGAGGVGSFAIQYASHLGAKVFTTGSAKRHDYLKKLGADVIIDYNKSDFVEIAKKHGGMDIVLESVGGDNYLRSIEATKVGGSIPSITHPPGPKEVELAKSKNIKTDFFLLEGVPADLDEISNLVKEGIVKTSVSKVYDFDQIKEAHTQMESGRTQGKIVLKVKK